MSGGHKGNPAGGSYSHIESLLRALHQPNLNVARPADVPSQSSPTPLVSTALGNIEENLEETLTPLEELDLHRPVLPVLFDIESVSETSSNAPSPLPSASDLEVMQVMATKPEDAPNAMTTSTSSRNLEENLERFNKNVLNVMDSLMKSRADSPHPITSSASTGKPFAFYHRMQRHNSAHSLNIPNIVVTGSGDPQTAHPHHHHKRFSFGLRRHSHAVVGGPSNRNGVRLE